MWAGGAPSMIGYKWLYKQASDHDSSFWVFSPSHLTLIVHVNKVSFKIYSFIHKRLKKFLKSTECLNWNPFGYSDKYINSD